MPKLIVIDAAGNSQNIDAANGLSVMEVLREAGLPVAGECGGSLACATCHVYVDPGWYDKLPEKDEAEEDMLDTAFNLTATSRLSCQIKMGAETDGLIVSLPA